MLMKQRDSQVENLPSFEVELLGRRINCITVSNIIAAINNACIEQKKIIVTHYNIHGFNLSLQLPWFYEFMQSTDITHCDSIGMLKAISYMKNRTLPIGYRASYTCLMPKLLEHCDRHHLSVFLLGSKPEYLQRALEHLRIDYPNMIVNGCDGYFSTEDISENAAVIHQINSIKPQILIVGMGMPIQENWVRLHQSRLAVNVILTGGAVIDRLAGAVPDCPKLLANSGWEWLYRLYLEPKRLAIRYLLGNPAFMFQIALAKFNSNYVNVINMQNVANSISGECADLTHLVMATPAVIDTTAIQ